MMAETTVQLDYANPPRWHRRRWFRRVMLGILLIALSAAAWRWGPEKWERAKLLYWQRQCMNYTAPADQIAYDQEPGGTSTLLKVGSRYTAWNEAFWLGPQGLARFTAAA